MYSLLCARESIYPGHKHIRSYLFNIYIIQTTWLTEEESSLPNNFKVVRWVKMKLRALPSKVNRNAGTHQQ